MILGLQAEVLSQDYKIITNLLQSESTRRIILSIRSCRTSVIRSTSLVCKSKLCIAYSEVELVWRLQGNTATSVAH